MKIRNYYRDLGKSTAILSVKQGLTLIIPFLILGSFVLLFKSFPYPPYQEFITAFLGGRILNILDATAMCITMLSCALFRLSVRAAKKFEAMHTAGAEYLFNLSILNLLSIVMITHLFAGAGVLLRERTASGFGKIYPEKSLYGYSKDESCVVPEPADFSQYLPEPAGTEELEQTCNGILVTL